MKRGLPGASVVVPSLPELLVDFKGSDKQRIQEAAATAYDVFGYTEEEWAEEMAGIANREAAMQLYSTCRALVQSKLEDQRNCRPAKLLLPGPRTDPAASTSGSMRVTPLPPSIPKDHAAFSTENGEKEKSMGEASRLLGLVKSAGSASTLLAEHGKLEGVALDRGGLCVYGGPD